MQRTSRLSEPAIDPLEEPVRRFLLTGDEEALDFVVRETRLRLLAAASRIGAPQDAEDSVQTAYLSLVRKRGEALGAPVFPWLLTAVIRIAYRRKALARREEALARRLSRPLTAPSPFALAAGQEISERIGRAVERLPASYRDPVVLHYLSGLPTAETARLLDLPEATVRTRLRRARILLRSRVPAGLLQAAWVGAWFLWDVVRGGGQSIGPAAAGGLVMKAGGVAAIAVVALALGLAAGAKLLGGPKEPPGLSPEAVEGKVRAGREEVAKADAAGLKTVQNERDDARKRAEQAEKDLAAARKETEEAKAAAETALKAAAAAAAPAGGAAKPKEGTVYFSFAEYDPALTTVDWKSVGESLRAMVPLIQKLGESAAKKEPPDLADVGKIQKHNGALIETAKKIVDKLPGSGVNGSFTHPAFMANSMAATLEAAGLPLTPAQAEALGKVARDYSDRDKARIQAYDERAFELQKVLDEADLKEKFFDAAFSVLTPEQSVALTPPAVKGVLSFDLFSSGLMLAGHIGPARVADRDAYVAQVLRVLTARGGVPAEKKEDLQRIVNEWAAGIPAAWFETETESVFGQPLLKVPFVLEVGRRELTLLQRVVQEAGLPEEKAQGLRAFGAVLLPIVNKGE